ncbi:hypothetical protein B0H19DRAFT_1288353 [Mycena capillaripes]|nr:hypothetical protein B0H19DRAFT_1288353 [Mycena capillaripes]
MSIGEELQLGCRLNSLSQTVDLRPAEALQLWRDASTYLILTSPPEIVQEIFTAFLPNYPNLRQVLGYSPHSNRVLFVKSRENCIQVVYSHSLESNPDTSELEDSEILDKKLELLITWLIRSAICPLSSSSHTTCHSSLRTPYTVRRCPGGSAYIQRSLFLSVFATLGLQEKHINKPIRTGLRTQFSKSHRLKLSERVHTTLWLICALLVAAMASQSAAVLVDSSESWSKHSAEVVEYRLSNPWLLGCNTLNFTVTSNGTQFDRLAILYSLSKTWKVKAAVLSQCKKITDGDRTILTAYTRVRIPDPCQPLEHDPPTFSVNIQHLFSVRKIDFANIFTLPQNTVEVYAEVERVHRPPTTGYIIDFDASIYVGITSFDVRQTSTPINWIIIWMSIYTHTVKHLGPPPIL